MTEDTGFPEFTEVPSLGTEPAPETPAEPAPDVETPAEPVPAEAVTEPPAEPAAELPPTAPFIPTDGVAGWLRDALLDLDRRLRNAGY